MSSGGDRFGIQLRPRRVSRVHVGEDSYGARYGQRTPVAMTSSRSHVPPHQRRSCTPPVRCRRTPLPLAGVHRVLRRRAGGGARARRRAAGRVPDRAFTAEPRPGAMATPHLGAPSSTMVKREGVPKSTPDEAPRHFRRRPGVATRSRADFVGVDPGDGPACRWRSDTRASVGDASSIAPWRLSGTGTTDAGIPRPQSGDRCRRR
jgi:hypothetical protein